MDIGYIKSRIHQIMENRIAMGAGEGMYGESLYDGGRRRRRHTRGGGEGGYRRRRHTRGGVVVGAAHNPWLSYLAKFRRQHPHLTVAEAAHEASKHYRR